MTVAEAHAILSEMVENGNGELELYTEYEMVTGFAIRFAESFREGSQCELQDNEPFVYVTSDH